MRPTFIQRLFGGSPDVRRCVEIRLSDFEVDDASALSFKGAGANENLKCGLDANALHAAGEFHVIGLIVSLENYLSNVLLTVSLVHAKPTYSSETGRSTRAYFSEPGSPLSLIISWYAPASTKHHAKNALIATVTVIFNHAGKATFKLLFTPKGRELLGHAKRVRMTARESFTPSGENGTRITKHFTLKR